MISCTKCRREKRFDEFHKDPSRKTGHTAWCKECRGVYNRTRRRKPRPIPDVIPTTRTCSGCGLTLPINCFRLRKKNDIHRHSQCNDCSSAWSADYHRKREYGVDSVEYQEMMKAQGGLCAICGLRARLVVDHCHRTGRVRGLLCQACNAGIGLLRESPANLVCAVRYLAKNA
jgi:hypothetical protein